MLWRGCAPWHLAAVVLIKAACSGGLSLRPSGYGLVVSAVSYSHTLLFRTSEDFEPVLH